MNDQQIDNSRLFKVIDNYLIDTNSLLGCGQYGNVFKGYEVNNYGRIFAIKETLISRKNVNQDTFMKKKEAAIREINSLKELNHPNVIRFINAKSTNKHLYLIMEYCSGGSLESYIEKNQPEERECLYLFSQIVNAFKYLIKEKKRRHGDIKPANILLHNSQAKLADFGFSKQFADETEQFISYTGSPLYTALQILEGKVYTTKSEIWSLGVTLHFMLCYNPQKRELSFPWYGGTDVHLVRNIKANPILKFSPENEEKLSPQIKQLLHRMLQVEEEKRMDWDELFSCSIFTFDFAQEIIYDEYQDEEQMEESQDLFEEKKDQVFDMSQARQLFTASFIHDPSSLGASQKSSEGSTSLSTSMNNMRHTTFGGQGNTQMTQSADDEVVTSLVKSKKITSIDVVHQQVYRGNGCLKDIQQGEQNSKLMQDLKEYIEQERQLSFFVYHTAKCFKECFEKLQLYFTTQSEAKLFEIKVLYILCKRSKILSKELISDIELKRSSHLLKGGGSSSSSGITPSQINQVLQQSKYMMPPSLNNIAASNTNQKQGANVIQKSVKNQNNNLVSQFGNNVTNSIVVISKEHWNYFSKNLIMKQTYEDKLKSEAKIYLENFTIYKQKLQDILNSMEKVDVEDKNVFTDDDNTLNLNYESHVIGQVLQIFLYELQRMSSKIKNQSNQSNTDVFASLNEEDLKQIYLIDDLFMIYSFESTFRNRFFQKKNEKINIQHFYFLRKNSNPLFLIQRLTQAYQTFFIYQ